MTASAAGGSGSATVRIYINARPVDAAAGSTPLAALERHDADAAALVSGGTRIMVDHRGLPAAMDEPVSNGSIFRVVSARQAS